MIDVGINRVMREGKLRLVGDIAFAEVRKVRAPSHRFLGVFGPMTIACLLANTATAAFGIAGLPAPEL